jgi:hypothetical protein
MFHEVYLFPGILSATSSFLNLPSSPLLFFLHFSCGLFHLLLPISGFSLSTFPAASCLGILSSLPQAFLASFYIHVLKVHLLISQLMDQCHHFHPCVKHAAQPFPTQCLCSQSKLIVTAQLNLNWSWS